MRSQELDDTGHAFIGFRTVEQAEQFAAQFGGQVVVVDEQALEEASEASVEAGFTVEGSGGVGWPVTETQEMTRRVLAAARA